MLSPCGHTTYPTRVQVHRSRLAVVRPGSCTSGTDRQLTVTLISSVCKYLHSIYIKYLYNI